MKLFCSIVILFVGFGVNAQNTMGPRTAVTLMGKQRLLTQKMTNAKVFLVTEVQSEKFKKEFDNSILLFAENLKNLQKYAPTKAIKKRTEYIATYWDGFKITASNLDTSKKAILNFVRNSETLYNLCDDAMSEMVKYAYDVNTINSEDTRNQETITKQINNVAKVRLGTIKLPLLYNLLIGNYEANNQKGLNKALENVTVGLTSLAAAEINNNTVDEAIANAIVEWNAFKLKYFKKGLNQFNDLRASPVALYDDVVALQSKLDKITFGYVSLAQ
jgi:hypothetical protein